MHWLFRLLGIWSITVVPCYLFGDYVWDLHLMGNLTMMELIGLSLFWILLVFKVKK